MLSPDEVDVYRTYASDGALALQDIEQCLLTLETMSRDVDELNRLYRALHTLKGNSALLGLTRIEAVAHAAEDMVGLVRDKGVQFGPDLVELLLRFKDMLGDRVARVGTEQCDAAEGAFDDLIEDIETWVLGNGGVLRAKQGAARGAFVLFSSAAPPGASSAHAAEADSAVGVERMLGLVRELLLALRADKAGGAGGEAFACSEALRLGGLHTGALQLATTAARIGELLVEAPGDRARLRGELGDLRTCVAALEARRLEATGIPEDFGLEPLWAALASHTLDAPDLASATVASPAAALQRAQDVVHLPAAPSSAREPAPVRSPASNGSVGDGPAAKPAQPGREGPEGKPDYLRIDARKLSLLMELAGEISLACGAVTHHPGLPAEMPEGFVNASQKLELLIRELQNEVSAMRLVPVSGVFQRMKRVVRDTCQRTGKKVELELVGEDTEIDKVMVDALHDPLVHLVRNAIDHGIETPAERLAAGKPEVGKLVLEAMHQGGEVSVQLHDDGRGMARTRIRARAEQRGLIAPDAQLSDAQILELVFLPGFSTKDTIDELSGRGVGMDVIRTTVQSLRGHVHITSREGHGSHVNMTLPLTLAFVEAMVVRERDQLFALPIEKVLEVYKPTPSQLIESSADGTLAMRLRERLIPVLWLHRYFNEPGPVDERLDQRVIVVTQTGQGVVAIPVQSLLGNQPIMLKPLRGVLANVRAAAGCGMLRTGDVALALDCDGLRA